MYLPGTDLKESIIHANLEYCYSAGKICIESFEDYSQLGRFTLRDQVSHYQSKADAYAKYFVAGPNNCYRK